MRASDAQVEAVRAAVVPVVDALGCTLYDVELVGPAANRILRVLVDRDGGVDIDTIAEATRAISPVLDDDESLAGPYVLEVSSPGVERPLRTPAHFSAATGAAVTVKFHTDAGPRRVRGTLVSANDDQVVVDADGEHVEIALHDVTQAHTVFEWGPQPRTRPGTAEPSRRASRARAKERS